MTWPTLRSLKLLRGLLLELRVSQSCSIISLLKARVALCLLLSFPLSPFISLLRASRMLVTPFCLLTNSLLQQDLSLLWAFSYLLKTKKRSATAPTLWRNKCAQVGLKLGDPSSVLDPEAAEGSVDSLLSTLNIHHTHGDLMGYGKDAMDQRHGKAYLFYLNLLGGWINDFMTAANQNQQQHAVFEQAWQQPSSARWANSFLQNEPPQSWANSFAAERKPTRWIDNFVDEEKSFDNIYNKYDRYLHLNSWKYRTKKPSSTMGRGL